MSHGNIQVHGGKGSRYRGGCVAIDEYMTYRILAKAHLQPIDRFADTVSSLQRPVRHVTHCLVDATAHRMNSMLTRVQHLEGDLFRTQGFRYRVVFDYFRACSLNDCNSHGPLTQKFTIAVAKALAINSLPFSLK